MKEDLTSEVKRIAKVLQFFKALAMRKFYGKTTASWEAGKIVNLKIEESFKVEE